MRLSFPEGALSLSRSSRIYYIWSGRTGISTVLLQQYVLKELLGRCSHDPGRDGCWESPEEKGLMNGGQVRCAVEEMLGAQCQHSGSWWRTQARGQKCLCLCLWQGEELCTNHLDRLNWRMGRRVYNASNPHSSLCINTPVTSSTSLQALGVGAQIFSGPRVRAFPPTTH